MMFLVGCSYDGGGSVVNYALQAQTYTGQLPDICMSACTLFLLRGCVSGDTELVFHLPSVDNDYWRGLMASHYPAKIAEWFMGLSPTQTTAPMSGADAIRLGATPC